MDIDMSTSSPTPKAPTPLPRKKKVHSTCYDVCMCVWVFVHHLLSCMTPMYCQNRK